MDVQAVLVEQVDLAGRAALVEQVGPAEQVVLVEQVDLADERHQVVSSEPVGLVAG